MLDAYCASDIGYWTSQCQMRRFLDSMPPGTAIVVALVLIGVLFAIGAALQAMLGDKDRD